MTPFSRFASVDEDDGSDKFESAYTPPGSDEDGSSQLAQAASTSPSSCMYELLNMFGVADSYPDTSVPREDAARYANLLQGTINAFDAALSGSSGDSPIANHRRHLLQDYRNNMYHRCGVVSDCSVVPSGYLYGLEARNHFVDVDNELASTFHDDFEPKHPATGIPAEQPVVDKKNIRSNTTSPIAAATAREKQPNHKQLIKAEFMSLSFEEKARVLLPLLQKLKPATQDLLAKSSVKQKASNYDQPHSNNSSTKSFPVPGSYDPNVDQVDKVWNTVERNSLELRSFEEVREQMGVQRDTDRLEEPPLPVRQTKLPQIVDSLISANDEPVNHHGSANTAQKEKATSSPTKNWQDLQSAMDGLGRTFAAYSGGCPGSYQRAFEHYNSLLSIFDKAKPYQDTSSEGMGDFSVICTIDDAKFEQHAEYRKGAPQPNSHVPVSDVDKFVTLTGGEFSPSKAVEVLKMCCGQYELAEAMYYKGGAYHVRQMLAMWECLPARKNNDIKQEHTGEDDRKNDATSKQTQGSSYTKPRSPRETILEMPTKRPSIGSSASSDRFSGMLCAVQSGAGMPKPSNDKPSLIPASQILTSANYILDLPKPDASIVSEQSHEKMPMSSDNAIPVATDNGCHWTEKQDQDLLYIKTTSPHGSWKSIAEEAGITGAQCMKRFQVIQPKASTSKVTSEETEDPEPKMTEAEKKAEKTAMRVEDAQQNLKVQLQPGVNTGRSMTTPEPFPTEDDQAICGHGSLEDEDVVFPHIWATAEDSEESKVGYNWTEEADQELVRLRRSKPKCPWPKIAKKLNAPIDLCKERFQLIKPRGSAKKASKEQRKAKKAKKASKVRWYDMKEGTSEPEFDLELQSDADMACSITPKSHQWGDDYGRTKILDQEAEQVGFGGGGDTGGFYGAWTNRVDPNKRSACVGDGGWGSAPRSDTEYDDWNRAAPASGPSSDDGGPVDAWSSCGSGSICDPASKIERAAAAPKPYEMTYWATVECGDQIVHIPIDSSNVAGPEKIILNGPAKKVWKWVQEKGLGDKIGLQDAFDLAKDIHGVDAVEEEKDYPDTPLSHASSFCRSYQDVRRQASRSSDVWNTSICVACGRDDTKCECGLGLNHCSKDKDGYYWGA